MDLAILICSRIGVDINVNDIKSCYRLGFHSRPNSKGELMPPKIMIEFVRDLTKESLMTASRNVNRTLTTADFGIVSTPLSKVYINERLTPYNQEILRQAIIYKNKSVIKFAWSKGGIIHGRVNVSSPVLTFESVGEVHAKIGGLNLPEDIIDKNTNAFSDPVDGMDLDPDAVDPDAGDPDEVCLPARSTSTTTSKRKTRAGSSKVVLSPEAPGSPEPPLKRSRGRPPSKDKEKKDKKAKKADTGRTTLTVDPSICLDPSIPSINIQPAVALFDEPATSSAAPVVSLVAPAISSAAQSASMAAPAASPVAPVSTLLPPVPVVPECSASVQFSQLGDETPA